MDELTIRRDRSFAVPQYQGVGRAEKPAGSSGSEKVTGGTGLDVSATLRELMGRVSQMESHTRESRRTLQKGESVLDEVQDRLGRITELVRESAEGESPDRAALQAELEQIGKDIDRMLNSAVADGVPLFLDEDPDGAQALLYTVMGEDSAIRGEIPDFPDWMNQLLEKVEEGLSPDQAIEELTDGEFTSLADFLAQSADDLSPELKQFLLNLLMNSGGLQLPVGSPLLAFLTGLEGMNLDLLMGLLTVSQSEAAAPERAAGTAGAAQGEMSGETDSVLQFDGMEVTGRDLSGVSLNRSANELTVSGTADVTLRGTADGAARERGEGVPSLRIAGSGTVTLQKVDTSALTVDADPAQIVCMDGSRLGRVLLREGASLTVEGGGLLQIGVLRGDGSNTLRLTGGAVAIGEEEDGFSGTTLAVPVILEGAASLAAGTANVSNGEGQPLEPLDLVWKTLLPGWSAITSMEVDGKAAKMALMSGDPARLWLWKGDQGYPIHSLVLQGRDASGQPRTRYAYLCWNQQAGTFTEVSMYPNPFAVTGGEQGMDWVYEEESQTLRILSARVTAVSGGTGRDTNREPFSGRIVLADGIGPVELSLEGVVCRVEEGRAFDLGRENDVTLFLQSGTSNLFESGTGCAGISLGDGTTLNIDCVRPEEGGSPDGILTATGGAGSAGIGWDGEGGQTRTGHILIRGGAGIGGGRQGFAGSVTIVGGMVASTGGRGGDVNMGISLQAGEDALMLPQFRLSARTLGLDRLSVLTRHYAQAAQAVVEADRRRVSQIRTVYDALYSRMEQSYGALPNVCRYFDEKKRLLRDTDSAGTLLEEMRRSILSQPSQAMHTHGRRGTEDVRQLFR